MGLSKLFSGMTKLMVNDPNDIHQLCADLALHNVIFKADRCAGWVKVQTHRVRELPMFTKVRTHEC